MPKLRIKKTKKKAKARKKKARKKPAAEKDTPIEADARKIMEFVLDHVAQAGVIEGTQKKGNKRVTFTGASFNFKTGSCRSHTSVIVNAIADALQAGGYKPREPSPLDERRRKPRPTKLRAIQRDHLIGEVKRLTDEVLDSAYSHGLSKSQSTIAVEEAAINWSPCG